MAAFQYTLPRGTETRHAGETSITLHTAGKYCEEDIYVSMNIVFKSDSISQSDNNEAIFATSTSENIGNTMELDREIFDGVDRESHYILKMTAQNSSATKVSKFVSLGNIALRSDYGIAGDSAPDAGYIENIPTTCCYLPARNHSSRNVPVFVKGNVYQRVEDGNPKRSLTMYLHTTDDTYYAYITELKLYRLASAIT